MEVLLKCCIRSATPQAALATQWFQKYIASSQLTSEIETDILPLAVGRLESNRLVLWATQTYPLCREPKNVPAPASSAGPLADGSRSHTAAPGSERQPEAVVPTHAAYDGGGSAMYIHPDRMADHHVTHPHTHGPQEGSGMATVWSVNPHPESAVPYAISTEVWGGVAEQPQSESAFSEHAYYNQLVVQCALAGDLAGAERTVHAAQQAQCILDSPA